jgi:hypothetical protein
VLILTASPDQQETDDSEILVEEKASSVRRELLQKGGITSAWFLTVERPKV